MPKISSKVTFFSSSSSFDLPRPERTAASTKTLNVLLCSCSCRCCCFLRGDDGDDDVSILSSFSTVVVVVVPAAMASVATPPRRRNEGFPYVSVPRRVDDDDDDDVDWRRSKGVFLIITFVIVLSLSFSSFNELLFCEEEVLSFSFLWLKTTCESTLEEKI